MLAIRNSPNTKPTLDLPIDSDVHIWHKKGGWKGPYKLLVTNSKICTVAMPYRPANFWLTVVKPYYTKKEPHDNYHNNQPHNNTVPITSNTVPTTRNTVPTTEPTTPSSKKAQHYG